MGKFGRLDEEKTEFAQILIIKSEIGRCNEKLDDFALNFQF